MFGSKAVHRMARDTRIASACRGERCAPAVAMSWLALLAVSAFMCFTMVLCGGTAFAAQLDSGEGQTTKNADVALDASAYVEYEPGVVVVAPIAGLDVEDVRTRLAGLDYIAAESLDASVASNFYVLQLTEDVSVEAAVSMLEAEPWVEYAQPNYIYRLIDGWEDEFSEPVDALKVRNGEALSALRSGVLSLPRLGAAASTTDAMVSEQWSLDVVEAQAAWDAVDACAPGARVTVAVIDTGANVEHEDLVNNIVGTYSVLNDSEDVTDVNGHGTHVAGIVAAQEDNGLGVAGVSHNAGLLVIQAIKSADGMAGGSTSITTADAARAVDYAISCASRYNVRVINMSFGGSMESVSANDKAFISSIANAKAAGLVVVGAAGNLLSENGGAVIWYPSDYSSDMLSIIGAMRNPDTGEMVRSPRSNYNRMVDGEVVRTHALSAPGGMRTPASGSESLYGVLSTIPSGYGYKNGTSMAAPVVSGIAALMYAACPDMTPDEAMTTLCATAADVAGSLTVPLSSGTRIEEYAEGFDAYTGYGVVNARRAVESASTRIAGADIVLKDGETALTIESYVDGAWVDGSVSDWSWTSGDASVAEIDEAGIVSGKAPGSAIVTATSKSNPSMTRTFTVTVYDPACSIIDPAFAASDDETKRVNYVLAGNEGVVVFDSGIEDDAVWTFSSSDETVLHVDEQTGGVVGVAGGVTAVRVELASNPDVFVEQEVVVEELPLAARLVLAVGETADLGMPSESNASWSTETSDGTIAHADASSGVVVGEATGHASVTFTTEGSYPVSRVLEIWVVKADIAGPDTVTIDSDGALTYSVTGEPQIADVLWRWSTSDASVASIDDDGSLVGLKAGSVTVSAVLLDGGRETGVKASKNVSVIEPAGTDEPGSPSSGAASSGSSSSSSSETTGSSSSAAQSGSSGAESQASQPAASESSQDSSDDTRSASSSSSSSPESGSSSSSSASSAAESSASSGSKSSGAEEGSSSSAQSGASGSSSQGGSSNASHSDSSAAPAGGEGASGGSGEPQGGAGASSGASSPSGSGSEDSSDPISSSDAQGPSSSASASSPASGASTASSADSSKSGSSSPSAGSEPSSSASADSAGTTSSSASSAGSSGNADSSSSDSPSSPSKPADNVPYKQTEQWSAVTPLYGETALDTMVAIVEKGDFAQGGIAVLATSDGYWDALTAAGIAGLVDAPILMTPSNELAVQTSGLLSKLAPETIIVCGGTEALTESVAFEAAKAAGGAQVVRCAGQTATGTACAIYESGAKRTQGEQLNAARTDVAWADTALLCTSQGYWDALAAAPVSYAKHMPIFLTEDANSVSSQTIETMREGGIKHVYIVGGPVAISDSVAEALDRSGISVADRLWGKTAVETSEAVALFGIEHGMSADNVGVATTNGYWDALSGAPFCGKLGSVIVLVDGERASTISGFVKSHASDIADVYVFGGPAAVSVPTRNALRVAAY